MIFEKIIMIMMLLTSLVDGESDCEKYRKLEIKDVASIKRSDLPEEFSDKAFRVVDEFIRKTIDLDYEILLFFDYITGKILKCKIGEKSTVELKFKDDEFNGKHVASIHNHTKDMYTPPSDKNFGIFLRQWEEYELIAANDCLWILKGKLKDEKTCFELKIMSNALFDISLENATSIHETKKEIEDKCDKMYGMLLSKYINDKNKKEIQLTKRVYSND